MKRNKPRSLPPLPWTFTLSSQLGQVMKRVDILAAEVDLMLIEYKHRQDSFKTLIHTQQRMIDMNRKDLDELRRENEQLKTSIQEKNSVIAELYQVVDDKDFRISECVKRINQEKVSGKETCECCCDEYDEDMFVYCTNGHALCKMCVNKQCDELNKSLSYSKDHMECCSIHLCNGVITAENIFKTTEGKKMIYDSYFQSIIPMLDTYMSEFNEVERASNLAFLKTDGTFRALQCPKCNYGPLLYDYCEDMIAHHGQTIDDGTWINNSCPNCQQLTENASLFPRWTGRNELKI